MKKKTANTPLRSIFQYMIVCCFFIHDLYFKFAILKNLFEQTQYKIYFMVFYFLDCFYICWPHWTIKNILLFTLKHSDLYCCHIELSAQLVLELLWRWTFIYINLLHKKLVYQKTANWSWFKTTKLKLWEIKLAHYTNPSVHDETNKDEPWKTFNIICGIHKP